MDDDDDFRVMFAEALRLDDIGVIEAAGGDQAIAVFDRLARSREEDPALLVLDLMMPVVSGIEVLQRLRRSQRWAQLPVLIMTAVNDSMLPVMLNVPVVFKPDMHGLLAAVRHNLVRGASALRGESARSEGSTTTSKESDRSNEVSVRRFRESEG